MHDLLGRTVATLVDATLPAGRHTVFFTAGALPGGVYLYRLHGDAATQHQFLVLVR